MAGILGMLLRRTMGDVTNIWASAPRDQEENGAVHKNPESSLPGARVHPFRAAW
ncbi:MAG TPA: hypothetical protein VMB81_31915 [Candidatus Sulfotelmatobacter sp.]|nr:hypothetical protein [Candidatus Sulfotelmatobacter sp.]